MLELFQISMALLVSLAGLIAAVAEGFPIAAFTLPIAFATWYFVDLTKLFAAPRWLAPILGIAAFTVAGVEYSAMGEKSYLSVGNHLLAYLTWILLVQEKETRSYWALFALSLMQIAVTSLLTFSIWFGVGLLAYAVVGTWTLSIFLLYRSMKSLHDREEEKPALRRVASDRTAGTRTWSGVSRDRNERLVTFRLYANTLSVTGVALVIAVLFFLFIPRIWSNPRVAKAGSPGSSTTGFSTEVRLGDMGEILESNDHVMEVRVFDAVTGTLLAPLASEKYLGAEPLFRGAVLEDYRQGRWHRPQFKASRRINAGIPNAKYRLRFDLAPIGADTIFSFGNAVGIATTKSYGSIVWDYFSNEMSRGEETDLDREFTYDLYTEAGPSDSWLSIQRRQELVSRNRFDPVTGMLPPMSERKFRQSLSSLTQLPGELQDLYPITEKVLGKTRDPEEAARKILEWLTYSGEFQYTMKLSVSDKEIDPILDFLLNRKTGHCEYFASAMATMLRCADIPSRVITGFKGGTFNRKSNTLTVQQFHAHAWVEAFINGKWMTFDPTPPERDETVHDIQGKPSSLVRTWRTAESVWHRFSILSRDAQDEKIYQPLVKRLEQIRDTGRELMQGRTTGLKSMLTFFTTPERWFTMEGAVVAVLLLLLILTISWLVRRIYQASRRIQDFLKSQAAASAGKATRVPFYERLLAILKEHGLTQQPAQTAREFIQSALPQLTPRLAEQGFDAFPQEVVDNFYSVRFGRVELSSPQMQRMEKGLQQLEACLKPREDEPA